MYIVEVYRNVAWRPVVWEKDLADAEAAFSRVCVENEGRGVILRGPGGVLMKKRSVRPEPETDEA